MARKRRKSEEHPGELNLTAMIDVAFQLLNFFVITSHPNNVYTNLNVFRPAPDAAAQPSDPNVNLIEIMVHPGGYILQKRPVTLSELDRQLTKIASFSKKTTITIKCTGDSSHAGLVNVLDLCAKSELSQVSVFSM